MDNQDLIQCHCHQPAPLLSILHAFHDRDGYLSDLVLDEVARTLRIPLADLFGTVTFYHHFARTPPGQHAPRVCTGPICCLGGARQVLEQLGPQASEMPCAGRCDQGVPVLLGDQVLDASLQPLASSLPVANPGGCQECVFANIREPGQATLEGYRRSGGYEGLTRAVTAMTGAQVLELISQSGLAGRGGAGFPTGSKWKLVAQAEGQPKTVVCNADEGEPGCFKDRALLDHDPHAVLEGILLAAYATGASRAFIYLRYEYPQTLAVLNRALQEARAAGLVGEAILGTDFHCQLYLRRGAGAYICGEEGALLNSLEGRHPFPRNRPPYPVTHGFENLPTAVNNVETLASVPPILRHGAAWYRGLGLNGQAGTKLISLSGDIQRPGNYEVPLGLPLQTLLQDWAGGAPAGHTIQAVTMAGLSGGFLAGAALQVTLDEPSIRSHGSFLGAGGIMVFHEGRDMVQIARQAMEFFAHESCGKCFPCRIGTRRLAERLAGESGPGELDRWLEEVADLGRTMKALSACGLGMAAPLVSESLNRYFPEAVAAHVGRNS